MKKLHLNWLRGGGTLRRVGLVLVLCLTVVGQMWAWTPVYLNGNFTGNNWNNASYQINYELDGSNSGHYFYPFYSTSGDKYWRLYQQKNYNNYQLSPSSDNYVQNVGTAGYKVGKNGEKNFKSTTIKNGVTAVHINQKSGGDESPYVWLERPTIYIWHNWNNNTSNWNNNGGSGQKAMTDKEDGTYTYDGLFAGTSSTQNKTNVGIEGSAAIKKYFSSTDATVVGSPTTGDKCRFTWNSSGYKGYDGETSHRGSLTITKLCKVTYNGNSKTSGTAPSTQADIMYNTSVTLASKGDLARTNYVFTGWNTSADGTGQHYDAGESVTITATTLALYAEWEPQWSIKGGATASGDAMGDWDKFNSLPFVSGTTYRGTISLDAKTVYDFKVVDRVNGDWYGKTSTSFTRTGTTSASGLVTTSGSTYNMSITTDAAGTYTFEWNTSGTKTISITYPTAYTITYGIGDLNGSNSSITATASPSFSSGDYVLRTTAVTFNKGTTKDGYHFDGWFPNSDGSGVAWSTTDANWTSAANTRSANIKVYACYSYQTYSITYKDEGNVDFSGTHGDGYPTTHTYNTGTDLVDPTKTGYDFDGWYTNSTCDDDPITSIGATAYTDNITLYAKWTAKEYTVTLDDRSATTAVSPSSVKATYDANTLSSSITNPAKTGGYTFAGWYLEYETGSGIGTSQLINTSGALNASVSPYTDGSRNWVNDGGVTVYARWKANANIGAFNFQYGSGTYYGSTWTVANFGDATNNKRTVDFTMPDPSSKKCYVGWGGDFIASGLGSGSGWSSEINLTAVRLAPCTSATVGTATGAVGKLVIFDNSSSANLYVGFEPSGYAVGTADRNIALTAGSDNFFYTDVVTITSTEAAGNFQVKLATSSSYTTCGHGTAENASTVSGRKITGDANIASGSKGVFQMWNNSETNNFGLRFVTVYDVAFDLQGHGDAISDYTDVRYNDKISAPTDPTEDGYVFHGWFKEAGCVNEWDFASDVVTTGTTLYAKWTSNIGTIDKTTGTTDGVYRATYGETSISITTAPTNAGYEVEGYYLTYNSGFQSPFSNPIATKAGVLVENTTYTDEDGKWDYEGDAPTIYANWQPKSYTLKLYQNDGTEDYTSITVTMGSSTCDPDITAPTRTGYSFGGYYTEESGGTKVINTDGSKPVTTYFDGSARWQYDGNVDLYAQWTPVDLTFSTAGSWSTPGNWSPACVPTSEHDVTISAAATIEGDDAVAKSVEIDGGSLTINAGAVLEVAGTVTNSDASKLVIKSNSTAQGALIFDNSASAKATVDIYTKLNTYDSYQVIAIPVTTTGVSESFAGSGVYTYVWNEGDGWERRGYYNDLDAFEAIALMQTASHTYTVSGTLASTDDFSETLAYTTGTYQGTNVFGNSWTAPIKIKEIEIPAEKAEQTVYVLENGNWVAYTLGSVANEVVPAMQAYAIIATATGGTVSIDYDNAVRGAASHNDALRAPQRSTSEDQVQIVLAISDGERQTALRLHEDALLFTEDFDNGWEARFLEGDGLSGQLYVQKENQMVVLAEPDLEGTVVGLIPGVATNYTISCEGNGNGYYLNDIVTEQSTLIAEGNSYMFTSDENTNATRFIISRMPINHMPTDIDNVQGNNVQSTKARKQMIDGILYIIRDGRIYSAQGALVK